MEELKYYKVFEVLVNNTKEYILNNNLKSMILGISGGIDSTVVAAICSEVSKRTEIPLIGRSLPIKNKREEFDVSKLVGGAFCNNFKVCEMQGIMSHFEAGVKYFENPNLMTPIAWGNIQARLRMIYLYNLASIYKGLVMSTDNQTEYQLGFWTLHGDVGDFNPLFGLWKTEVYGLAKYLAEKYANDVEFTAGHKERTILINKAEALFKSIELTPTDGLGISNSDLEQIGAKNYSEVDDILQTMLLHENSESEKWDYLYNKYGSEVTNKVWNRHLASEFKRQNLPVVIERSKYV